jgi:hypothetical protein
MKNKGKIGILLMMGMGIILILISSMSYATSPSSRDIHNINVQIFGNENNTGGFPAYLTNQSTYGNMPEYMFLTARSPGNSTLSVSINTTYYYHDVAFSNITTLPFNLHATGQFTITIVISSSTMSRTFHYHANIMTGQQFIAYEQNRLEAPKVSSFTTASAFVTFGIPAATGVAVGLIFSSYVKWEKNRNLDFDKCKV